MHHEHRIVSLKDGLYRGRQYWDSRWVYIDDICEYTELRSDDGCTIVVRADHDAPIDDDDNHYDYGALGRDERIVWLAHNAKGLVTYCAPGFAVDLDTADEDDDEEADDEETDEDEEEE